MKRKISKIAVIIMITTLALSLAACGTSDVVGTWEAKSYKINDEIKSFEEYGLGGLEITLEFTKDGKINSVNNDQKAEGTWEEKDDNKIAVTIAGSTQEMILDGENLLMGEKESGYVVFEKK